MQKENFRDTEYPRFKVHWSVKLLGWAWVAALVFIAGMVIGGMLGFIDEPGEEGPDTRAVQEAGHAPEDFRSERRAEDLGSQALAIE